MSAVVFILGAGASKQAGGPLMSEFLNVASELLLADVVGGKSEEFKEAFRAIAGLQRVHSKAYLDLRNIESVFTALELGKVIQKVPGLEKEQIPSAIAALKEVIVRTLELTVKIPFSVTKIDGQDNYWDFANLIKHIQESAFPKRTASIITFNYDMAIDVALHNAGFVSDYGLDETAKDVNTISLLKLHGSLNWATEVGTKRILALRIPEYLPFFKAKDGFFTTRKVFPIGTDLQECFLKEKGISVEQQPVIIPPSWNKADYHQALSNVWSVAAKNLSEAEYIFVIGYSLPETDSFFRHLYALGSVGEAILKKIVVFNPDGTGATDARFRSLLGLSAKEIYEYRQEVFSKAIDNIYAMFPSDA